jgi:adenylate cyclase
MVAVPIFAPRSEKPLLTVPPPAASIDAIRRYCYDSPEQTANGDATMPQLVIEQPGVPPMTVPLLKEDIRLGRAEDNEVVLVADEVSRHHARLTRRGDRFLLEDLKSMNGTYVNQQRVVQRVLSHLDEIWFGSKCHMVFRDDTHAGRPGDGTKLKDSSLIEDLDKIRAELTQAGNNLTLIGRRGDTPVDLADAVRTPTPKELVAMSRAYHRLSALYHASNVMASAENLPQRLAGVLDAAIQVLEAERGFVMLRDESDGSLRVTVARQMGQDLQAGSPSMGIAGRAAIDGEPVLMDESKRDTALSGRESVIVQRIASAMCVPLRLEDRILGSMYVDTRKVGHRFSEEDLELFASLASQSAMAIENVRLYERMVETEKKRANLGRFLSPAVVDMVMSESTTLELGGAKRTVTTMFCDIRSFTLLAERTAPDELVVLLNEHFTEMTEIIFSYRGTLDKYIGDEIMAVWGAPLSAPDDPFRAIGAAMAMQEANAQLNKKRAAEGRPQFEMGIGIDTGEVIAGFMGSPERMEFTVVGDRVNTARRLCSLAGPGQVVIGEPTYNTVQDQVDARAIGTVMLKGKEQPVHAYEVTRLQPTGSRG